MRIRTKVLLAALTLVMITGISVILVVRNISKQTIEEQTFNHLVTIAEARTEQIKSILDEYGQLTRMVSTGNVFVDLVSETEPCKEAIEAGNRRISAMITSNESISRIRVLDRNGFVIASSHTDIGADNSTDTIFLNVLDGATYIGELHFYFLMIFPSAITILGKAARSRGLRSHTRRLAVLSASTVPS